MIAAALEAEVDDYVSSFTDEVDEDGKRLVVRNGRARERRLTVGSERCRSGRRGSTTSASPADWRAQAIQFEHPAGVADAEALAGWLAEHVASGERRPERVREELIVRCRAELIEPPTLERLSEIARSALHRAEQALLALITARLDPVVVARLKALIAVSDDNDEDENMLGLIKAAPGNVSLETMLVEISKLEALRAIGLPADLFDGIDARIITRVVRSLQRGLGDLAQQRLLNRSRA